MRINLFMEVAMSQQTEAERELAELLVESLNLEDVDPAAIAPEAALFNDGLGLDSIDALELALAIGKPTMRRVPSSRIARPAAATTRSSVVG